MKHSPRKKAGYGDVRRQLASTQCEWWGRPRRSPRSIVSECPLWAREHLRMVFSTLQWCWTHGRTWLARLCGTRSALLSRKTGSREGDSDAFTTIGNMCFSGPKRIFSATHLRQCLKIWTLIISCCESTACLWVKPVMLQEISLWLCIFGKCTKLQSSTKKKKIIITIEKHV